MAKRIAVVGAGVSGLVTVKELLEAGHHPVCFERAASLGGVFRFGEEDGVLWESCRLTSSGLLTAFSDFPVSPERAEHMHASEFVRYLRDYCEEFGVLEHVRFGQQVESLVQNPDGSWTIKTTSRAAGPAETLVETLAETFDAVAVCSGLHQHPLMPEFPGQSVFQGEILHAARYRRPAQVEGKRVLIVGAGESGADIAAEVADHAEQAVLSLRRGVAVLSRWAFGKPRDYVTSRIQNSPSRWVFQTRNPGDRQKLNRYRLLGLPVVIVDKLLQILYQQFWIKLPTYFSGSREEIRVKQLTRKLNMQLLQESGGTLHEQFATKDEDFVRAIACGKLTRVPGVHHFEADRVVFTDNSSMQPELVIFCTGFETRMPFLEATIATAPRYLNTFNPAVGAGLGFIGFVRPAIGAIPPLAELQARWFARLQSGDTALPAQEAMQQSIEEWTARRHYVFRAKEDRLTHLVDYTEYCDLLAEQVGCKPRQSDLDKESRAFRKRFWSGPFVAAQYRLAGPGAKPETARRTIESMPLAHPWPERLNMYLRWSLCRVLHRLLGPDYAPKLSIDQPDVRPAAVSTENLR